jgi:peptide-methionine (S)-S-oxide reductase
MLSFFRKSATLPGPGEALPGRPEPIPTATESRVGAHHALKGPYPAGIEIAYFGMGCFWGAERMFWRLGPGIHVTAVGYQGGETPNPTYEEVCTGQTGHTEVVLVAYDPTVISYDALLKAFWENHDPTQGMRQGNDVGTQYRSAIYTTSPAQAEAAERSKEAYTDALRSKGLGPVTTEIRPAPAFYFAEDYHQQYLDRVPHGYCNLAGTGVSCPVGLGVAAE